jgi:hypothetical protein
MLKGTALTNIIREGVQAGESTAGLLRSVRAAGGHIETYAFEKMVGEVRNELALGGISAAAPLNRKPSQDEIIKMSTKRAGGYSQDVQVIGLNAKGEAFTITRNIGSEELYSREKAIRLAIESVQNSTTQDGINRESSPVRIIAAFHGATYIREPE